jgi:hypothetical protein
VKDKTKKVLAVRQIMPAEKVSERLFEDIRKLINSAKSHVARVASASMVQLYWHIGNRIRRDTLGMERAPYGEQIVATVAQQLTAEYGDGYTKSALSRLIKFSEMFPTKSIVATLSHKLSWSHFRELITIKDV